MSLDALEACQRALISALDCDDHARITAAAAAMQDALLELSGAVDQPADKAQAMRLMDLFDAAQERVNFLTDRTRRRIQVMESARGRVTSETYGRSPRAL